MFLSCDARISAPQMELATIILYSYDKKSKKTFVKIMQNKSICEFVKLVRRPSWLGFQNC